MRVGERVVEDRRQQDPGEPAVGPVQDVEPDLLLDDVDLVAQVLLGQLRRAQPVGLQEQRPLQRGGGQHLEVVGVVLVGGAVEHPAGALDVPEVGELLQALAALEHEVLEQVREAGAALGLGAEPDVDVHGDADDRGGGIGDDEHAQAVRQRRPMQFWGRHPTNLTRGRQCLLVDASGEDQAADREQHAVRDPQRRVGEELGQVEHRARREDDAHAPHRDHGEDARDRQQPEAEANTVSWVAPIRRAGG